MYFWLSSVSIKQASALCRCYASTTVITVSSGGCPNALSSPGFTWSPRLIPTPRTNWRLVCGSFNDKVVSKVLPIISISGPAAASIDRKSLSVPAAATKNSVLPAPWAWEEATLCSRKRPRWPRWRLDQPVKSEGHCRPGASIRLHAAKWHLLVPSLTPTSPFAPGFVRRRLCFHPFPRSCSSSPFNHGGCRGWTNIFGPIQCGCLINIVEYQGDGLPKSDVSNAIACFCWHTACNKNKLCKHMHHTEHQKNDNPNPSVLAAFRLQR